jgi:hypothetical protein
MEHIGMEIVFIYSTEGWANVLVNQSHYDAYNLSPK